MKIEYLKEIMMLERHGNFLEASDNLYMSQSSLSRHVQRIENELGFPLFKRTTRKLEISDEGKILLPYLREMVCVYDELLEDLEVEARENAGELVIAFSLHALAPYGITGFLGEAESSIPSIGSISFEMIQEDVMRSRFDFAFVREIKGRENQNFNHLYIGEDMLVAVLPKDHPLAEENEITMKQLRYERFALTDKKSFLWKLCGEEFERAGFTPNIAYSGIHGRNLIDMLVGEKCCSLLFKKTAEYLYGEYVSIVNLVPGIPIQISMIWPKKTLNETSAQFVRLAEEYFSRKQQPA